MKKVFVMLFAVVIAASAWASPSPSPVENEKVMAAFEKQFTEAVDVSWTEKQGYFLASFKLNNDRMLAWYTADGEVEAVHRLIQQKQMTFLASEAVTQLTKDKQILNIAEISKQGELFYLVKTDEAKCFSIYKVSASGDYTRISKTKKRK
ncbi:hypothetical protein [Lacibacter sp.]|uniref:hypothetical protein n=1 Tax=Lacibacter sp. TaxID=1915409 RepID=UPI002B4B2C51|nr:hypothetical protein [Lacibacter sp.]HLP38406.1 hypothetical protein [Lacibacter sp.]